MTGVLAFRAPAHCRNLRHPPGHGVAHHLGIGSTEHTIGENSMGTTTTRRDPVAIAALEAKTLCEAFQITAAGRPDAVALRTPGDGLVVTWSEYADQARR